MPWSQQSTTPALSAWSETWPATRRSSHRRRQRGPRSIVWLDRGSNSTPGHARYPATTQLPVPSACPRRVVPPASAQRPVLIPLKGIGDTHGRTDELEPIGEADLRQCLRAERTSSQPRGEVLEEPLKT